MTPQELKNSILQLAIQGKLVEQRPEEGTAQELYAQIQAEKQRLIKEGKLKKEKTCPRSPRRRSPSRFQRGGCGVGLEMFQLIRSAKKKYPQLILQMICGLWI